LSTKLKRIVEALAVAALSVAVLAALPERAEAQGTSSTGAAQGTDRVVVAPGESLWSISQERLGPQAAPPRIAREVERIYALNRSRIGPDPNLIFPGQELSLPPTAGQPASAGAPLAREATGGAQAGSKGSAAAERGPAQAARTTVVAQKKRAPDRVAEAPNLPKAVETPAVGSPAEDASPRPSVAPLLERASSTFASAASALGETLTQIRAAGWRLLLVVGTWLLTFALVVLMVWKLPMRRTTRWDAERWGIPMGYGARGYEETSYEETSRVPFVVPRRSRRSPGRSPGRSPAPAWVAGGETGSDDQTGDAKPPRQERTGPARAPNGRPSPSGGLALAAHDRRVRRAVLRARTPMRARKARAARSGAEKRTGSRPRPGFRARPKGRGVER
jgi:LysM repeat protein